MRTFFLLFICFILTKCEIPKKTKTTELVVPLDQQLGYGPFEPGRKVLFPLNPRKADSLKQTQRVDDFFEEYVIRKYILNDALAMYRKWQAGEIDDKRWEILKRVYNIKPNQLIDINPKNEVLIAYGSDQNGKRALQVDTDLDGSLTNDSLVQIEYPLEFVNEEDKEYYLKHQLKYLPQFELSINYQKNNEQIKQDFTLLIDTYNVDDLVRYVEGDEVERSYFLSVSIPAYFIDTLKLNNSDYDIKLAGRFKEPLLKYEDVNIHITKIDSGATSTDIQEYQIKDSLILDGEPWRIDDIKKNGSALKLRQLPDSTRIYRLEKGYYFPALPSKPIHANVDQEEKSNNTTYWVWNTQTLNDNLIDQIAQWQQNNTQKSLMTIAYDINRGAVKRMIDRYQLNLTTFYIDPKNSPANLELLTSKIPFKIRLDEQGKILRLEELDFSKAQNSVQ